MGREGRREGGREGGREGEEEGREGGRERGRGGRERRKGGRESKYDINVSCTSQQIFYLVITWHWGRWAYQWSSLMVEMKGHTSSFE